jgi:hypothetical protein
MSRKDLGKVPAKVAEQYSAEADELGLSRGAYVRQRIEAGRFLFKSSGQIDTQLLRELVDHDDTATFETELNTLDDDLDDELTESILANLPTEAARQLTEEELREAVFGTEKEQLEQIREALKQLREAGKIESLVGDGYIKTND